MPDRHRIIRATTKVMHAKAGRVHAVVSTETKDRDGDIIRTAGWDLGRFRDHPVLLSSHNYLQLRSQIGKWESMEVTESKQLEGVAQYYVGRGNEEADWGFHLAQEGMAAFSVGFLPDMAKAKVLEGGGDDTWNRNFEFNGQELLEVSHVTIPSNPEALQAIKGLGSKLHPVLTELLDDVLEGMGEGQRALEIAALCSGHDHALDGCEATIELADQIYDYHEDVTGLFKRHIEEFHQPINYQALLGDAMRRHLEEK